MPIEYVARQPWMREVTQPVHIDTRWWPPHVPYPTHCIYTMPQLSQSYYTADTTDPPRTIDFEEAAE